MPGIGGPEIGGKNQLKVEYSREERLAVGRYQQKKPKGKSWLTSRKILLLDLAIILFFACVLYPLMLKKQETRRVEGYICTIKFRKGKGLSGVEIFVTADENSQKADIIEITLRDKKGNTYFGWTDVVPETGETRTYMKAFENGKVQDVRILINGTEKVISLSRFRVPFFLLKQKD